MRRVRSPRTRCSSISGLSYVTSRILWSDMKAAGRPSSSSLLFLFPFCHETGFTSVSSCTDWVREPMCSCPTPIAAQPPENPASPQKGQKMVNPFFWGISWKCIWKYWASWVCQKERSDKLFLLFLSQVVYTLSWFQLG